MLNSRASIINVLTNTGKKHVALLYGGISCEKDISLASGQQVATALVNNGYRVTCIDVGIDFESRIGDVKPDVVFNCLHGTFGEDGDVPAILNTLKIPYSHSGADASKNAFNKHQAKVIFLENNIKTPESVTLSQWEVTLEDPIPKPYIIKPLRQGSSHGIEIRFAESQASVADYDFKFDDTILVEKYIKGRELQVAVLDDKALGVLEIELLNGKSFYDYESKYTRGYTNHIMPAKLSADITRKVLEISEKIYEVFNCRGLCRVELILCEDEIYAIELNTHPGMTEFSICPEIAKYAGIDFNELVERMLITAKCD